MAELYDSQTENLLRLCAEGRTSAVDELFSLHRQRLKQMVSVRLDRRIVHRVDESDIVQETLSEVVKKLPEYLQSRPIGFYPWLRQLALEQIIAQQRRHLEAEKRSVSREQSYQLPDHSAMELAELLVSSASSPSQIVKQDELRKQIWEAIDQLKPVDREVLVLRRLEQLSTKETAEVLGLSEASVKSRQRRAIERLSVLLDGLGE